MLQPSRRADTCRVAMSSLQQLVSMLLYPHCAPVSISVDKSLRAGTEGDTLCVRGNQINNLQSSVPQIVKVALKEAALLVKIRICRCIGVDRPGLRGLSICSITPATICPDYSSFGKGRIYSCKAKRV